MSDIKGFSKPATKFNEMDLHKSAGILEDYNVGKVDYLQELEVQDINKSTQNPITIHGATTYNGETSFNGDVIIESLYKLSFGGSSSSNPYIFNNSIVGGLVLDTNTNSDFLIATRSGKKLQVLSNANDDILSLYNDDSNTDALVINEVGNDRGMRVEILGNQNAFVINNGTAKATFGIPLNISGAIVGTGNNVFTGTNLLSGASTFGSSVNMSGAVLHAGTLTQSGAALFKNQVTISGANASVYELVLDNAQNTAGAWKIWTGGTGNFDGYLKFGINPANQNDFKFAFTNTGEPAFNTSLYLINGTGLLYIANANSGLYFQGNQVDLTSTADMTISAGNYGNYRAIFKSTGEIGFGISNSTPTHKFHVSGASLFYGGTTISGGVLQIQNVAQPTTPTGSGRIFVSGGALYYIGSGGTVTNIAVA